jgi:hypothetical protein
MNPRYSELQRRKRELARKRLNAPWWLRKISCARFGSSHSARRADARGMGWKGTQPLLDQPSVHLDRPRPSREDLHER